MYPLVETLCNGIDLLNLSMLFLNFLFPSDFTWEFIISVNNTNYLFFCYPVCWSLVHWYCLFHSSDPENTRTNLLSFLCSGSIYL